MPQLCWPERVFCRGVVTLPMVFCSPSWGTACRHLWAVCSAVGSSVTRPFNRDSKDLCSVTAVLSPLCICVDCLQSCGWWEDLRLYSQACDGVPVVYYPYAQSLMQVLSYIYPWPQMSTHCLFPADDCLDCDDLWLLTFPASLSNATCSCLALLKKGPLDLLICFWQVTSWSSFFKYVGVEKKSSTLCHGNLS